MAPHHPRGTQPPQGVQAKPNREEPGPDQPPPSTPDGARDWGRTRGGARTTWNGPTSAQCRDCAGCPRHTTQGGGGGRRGGASADTPKGHAGTTRRATGPSSRNAQTAWNGVPASEGKDTRTGRPATRSAGQAGWKRQNGRDTTPGTGPSPPNRPRAPRTHGRGTALAKAVVAHCATPQPLGKAASAPAQGGPTGDKPVAQARRRRRPGRPRIRGATRWVSTRSHGCELMH